MEEFIKYIGMDVHGKTIAVAVADSRSSEVRFIGQIVNTSNLIQFIWSVTVYWLRVSMLRIFVRPVASVNFLFLTLEAPGVESFV